MDDLKESKNMTAYLYIFLTYSQSGHHNHQLTAHTASLARYDRIANYFKSLAELSH